MGNVKIGGPRCDTCKQPAGMCKCVKTLRDRCKVFLNEAQRRALLREGSPVDDLLAFVCAEIGRKGDASLDQTLPLCLYFATDEDREGFIRSVYEVFPNMIAKRMP